MKHFRRASRSLPLVLGLFLLPLIFFGPVTFGSRTLLPVDNLFSIEPYRSAASELSVEQPHNGLLSDLILENYAWKRFTAQSIQARQLPLWNPYLFAGNPFLATGQHSALYPFNAVFYVLPLWRAFGLFVAIQLGLAGVFMFAFARVLRISRLGATVAGITFELSGFLVVSAVHPMIIAAAAWLPLILAAIELIIQQGPIRGRPATVPWVLLGALALGCSGLAGHAEVLYFSLLVAAFFAAWRLIHRFSNFPGAVTTHPNAPERVRDPRFGQNLRFQRQDAGSRTRLEHQAERLPSADKLVRPAAWILAMVLLGLALGGIQLIPYVEIVNASFRQGRASLSQVRGWAYPLRRVITFFVPNFFGNPTHREYIDVFGGRVIQTSVPIDWGIKNYVEGGAYLGLLPLALAALAILTGFQRGRNVRARMIGFLRHPHIPLFLVLALLSLAFIFGTPLYALVYALPFLSQSHSPFRWVFPLTLSVAVLAGFGIDALRQSRHSTRAARSLAPPRRAAASARGWSIVKRLIFLDSTPSLATLLAALTFWSGLLLTVSLIASRTLFDRLAPALTRLFHSLAGADTVFPDARAFYSYEFRWILQAGLLLMATGIVLRVSRCPIYFPPRRRGGGQGGLGRRPVWEALAVGLLTLDLFTFGYGFHAAADPALLDYVPPVVEHLKQDTSLWRLTSYDPPGDHGDKRTFHANAPWFYDLQDVRGYDSLFTAQYRDYMRLIDEQDELDYNRIAPLRRWSGLDSPLLDMLNVKYVLTEFTEERLDKSPKYKLVYSDESLQVYENLGAMPRAYLMDTACTHVSADPLGAMQSVDPRHTVIVEPGDWPPTETPSDASCAPDPAKVTLYTPNQVFIDARPAVTSWLVLSDSYFPGWKAFVRPLGGDESDESELHIARVAGNFRGVVLEPGAWTIRFKYSPNSVKIGAFVSFLGGIICLFLAGAWAWRFFYREEEDASTARRVAKNSVVPILLHLMNRVVDMGFAALMARVLGPDGSGKYFYAIVVFGWFEIIGNWGLNALLLREVARNKNRANRYFVNTTVLRLILLGLSVPFLALFLLGRQTLLDTRLAGDTIVAIVLLFVGLAPATVSAGLTALFQAFEKHEIPAAVTSVATLIKVTLGTLVLMMGWNIIGLAGVSIATNLVTLIILAILATRLFFRPRVESDWRLQRAMAVESFPLMLNHLMATLFFKVDVILLEALRNRRGIPGDVTVGWYSWAYKGVEALNIIPAFFTFAIFPVMARQAHEDRSALNATYHLAIKLLVVVALPAAMAMTLLAKPFIALLGGNAFLPHSANALQLMVWSIPIGWINSVTNYVLIAIDRQHFLTRAFVIGLTFNLVANLLFIPQYDYHAAAIITILSELILLAAFYAGVRRYLAPIPWLALLWKPGLSGAAMAAVGVALWPTSTLLALLVSLGAYGMGLAVLRAFSPTDIARILGRHSL